MSAWQIVLAAVPGAIALSILTGLVVAAVLGQISRESSLLFDLEPWASAPVTRCDDSSVRLATSDVTAPTQP